MSKISLKHSGGNVVSLNSPTSAPTSADVAFKLPNADGSAGQFMKTDGSGNLSFDTVTVPSTIIRQHKILSKTTKSSTTSTSLGIIPDFSITITPTASDSIMVVEANMFLSNSGHVICSRIYNGTSFLISPNSFPPSNNQNGTSSIYHGSGEYMEQQHLMAFETSGNTNARTYSLYWNVTGGTGYINRWHGSSIYHSVSTFRVTEVAP